MTESNRIEYKAKLTQELDLEKEVIAFLNYPEGGLIYIGINKQGKVIGVADQDGDMLKIKDRIKHNVSPSAMGLFDVVAEERGNLPIIKIIIASGSEKPYFKKKYGMTEKGCFIRIGTASEPMPQKIIEKKFASRTRSTISKIRANRQTLTFAQLHIYYQEKNKPLNKQFATNLELLTPQGDFNYAAYLLADENSLSVKVARYQDHTRLDLIESNEYGHTSLLRATQSVLDKLHIENRTFTQITSKERREHRLWHELAIREAVINAFVHNDYTREIAPKIEIFSDRIEITSAGSLPEGMSEAEFFEGYSIPRNKELMRVYRDLDLVEQLGSGVPRILMFYDRSCFRFTDNFLRMTFPVLQTDATTHQDTLQDTHQDNPQENRQKGSQAYSHKPSQTLDPEFPQNTLQDTHQDTPQVTPQVQRLLALMDKESSRIELQEKIGLSDRGNFNKNYLQPAIAQGLIAFTIPDKPSSKNQRYRLTKLGKAAYQASQK